MNCKPGDIALVVKANLTENLGKLCEVLGPSPDPGDWLIRFGRQIRWGDGRVHTDGACPDAWLRPIRPNDGEDEMLRIAGLPMEVA